ncbi:MAG: hypothetical protein RBR25_14010 [Trichloromonas sp.]|jgi:methylglyoxal synthase|nr:hypothetical protein [Trichloromonas sp.]
MRKTIGLVAHDNRKEDLIEWVQYNAKRISKHKLVCTGTTGKLIMVALDEKGYSTEMEILKSGPLGGD